jgi:hypothetical protein
MPHSLSPRDQLARTIYPDPDPFLDSESHARANHLDLPAMEPARRRQELEQARLRRLLDDHPSDWLLERLERLPGRSPQ